MHINIDIIYVYAPGIKREGKWMCALTVLCRNQLSCMEWMWGPHRTQRQDFFCAAGALDGQFYLLVREPWNQDTHLKDICSGFSDYMLMGNTKWLLGCHNMCLNTSQAPHKSLDYNQEEVCPIFIQFYLPSCQKCIFIS